MNAQATLFFDAVYVVPGRCACLRTGDSIGRECGSVGISDDTAHAGGAPVDTISVCEWSRCWWTAGPHTGRVACGQEFSVSMLIEER